MVAKFFRVRTTFIDRHRQLRRLALRSFQFGGCHLNSAGETKAAAIRVVNFIYSNADHKQK
jgi:hypothetical protein